MQSLKLAPSWLRLFVVVLLVVGVFFRCFHLDYKLYWHDEVYTTFRAAGFTGQEISQEIFKNQILSPQAIQKYQRLQPGSTFQDTIKSLAVEDPQHPPLYFLMTRLWMQIFGSSIAASRALAVVLSLLALSLMYALAINLFSSQITAWLATALLAISPFDILFAQIARQYSFLTLCVIASSLILLRALRSFKWYNWGLYTVAITVGLYGHPFFGLTMIAHVAYVLLRQLTEKPSQFDIKQLSLLILAIAASIILYSPWLLVIKTNYQRVLDTTNWAKGGDIIYLVKLWILSFTALFFDLDFGFDNIWTYIWRIPILLLIFIALYELYRRTHPATWLFILTTIFVPFLILAVPDLLLGTKRSAVSRYLISCFPGIQLAIAYLLTTKLIQVKRLWQGISIVLVAGSIASATVSAYSHTWWTNIPSYFNAEIAQRINTISAPVIISDAGNDGTNLGDLISLSYLLHDQARLLLLSQPPQIDNNLQSLLADKSQLFFFRPSQKLVKLIEPAQGKLVPIVPAGGLWQLEY
ncbi:glycosyltransferase family 39 protein [Nostoc sp. TCL26-01]|uniref:glycosyltransferase family 39 protein n=1 Tax=Nostoc sp. TCL26-01 TaxID=2576904 RepID=UPI0015C1352D|nr:glycosyltransferase family 39 protein [Nostoc sp. TCL26-01]QLE55112.1 glycosyl transferase family 39 [Nostoc sp. TCL26-01]